MVAVVELGDEKSDLRFAMRDRHDGFHADRFGEFVKGLRHGFRGEGAFVAPLNALKKDTFFLIAMLVSVDDITGVFEYPAGDFGDDTLVVGTVEEGYKTTNQRTLPTKLNDEKYKVLPGVRSN